MVSIKYKIGLSSLTGPRCISPLVCDANQLWASFFIGVTMGKNKTYIDHRYLIRCALKASIIRKSKKCEYCGDMAKKINAHHDDYDKPLEIKWLCNKCHLRLHLCKPKPMIHRKQRKRNDCPRQIIIKGKTTHFPTLRKDPAINSGLLIESKVVDEHEYFSDYLKIDYDELLKQLTYREREIIKLRYGIGDGYAYTLKEISEIFRVTRERVRQVEAKAIRKLRFLMRHEFEEQQWTVKTAN
ncbi:MAG: sigma-70 family RNA polymerase sigma factor [Candidatus Peribacteraceae bacterium]|nr:sigma-70 family RNA polymerase sigma factor [Candidatus Peribacteraceae bacterium]